MPALSYRHSPDQRGASPWRRAASLLLTIAIHILLLWLLLNIAPQIPRRPPGTSLTSFDVAAEGERADAPAPAAKAERRASERAPESSQPPPPPPPPPPPVTVERPGAITLPSEIISLSRSDYAGSNVANIARAPRGDAVADKAGSERGGAGEAAASGGAAGERMYDVDWYRRPTSAELAFYLPKRSGPIVGWGLIACRTAANYRVEECRELDQYPPGSGLSRAVRQAAWQFRVLPPRRGSTPIMGAWVRIRIEYSPRGAEAQ